MRRTWSVVIRGGYAASEEECGSARRSAPGLGEVVTVVSLSADSSMA